MKRERRSLFGGREYRSFLEVCGKKKGSGKVAGGKEAFPAAVDPIRCPKCQLSNVPICSKR